MLPEWVGTSQINGCNIIYGGFDPKWAAAQLERSIIDDIARQLSIQCKNKNCVVAGTAWHEPAHLIHDIAAFNPDITVLCGLSDPLGPVEKLFNHLPGKVILFGYVDQGHKFDFWAVACLKNFKQYKNQDLYPGKFDHVYINYNRKPRAHRIKLVDLLEEQDLIKYGIVTLGNSDYTIKDCVTDFIKFGANEVIGDVGIPNDIYSLGRMDIWNSSFLNIVSETEYEYGPNIFVSEKIYKPIMGLRPFVVNGSPGIYRWLKAAGFDCFDDLFPVGKLADECLPLGEKYRNHQIIVDIVKDLSSKNLTELYKSLWPRLLQNQKLFNEYAKNQKIDTIF